MANRITTEIFINRARKIHGSKYDYSKVEYNNSKSKDDNSGEFAQ